MNKIEDTKPYQHEELYLSDFIKTITYYKGTVTIVTLVILIASLIYLYFTPAQYVAYATIKTRQNPIVNHNSIDYDPISSIFSQSLSTNIEQEISILQSFYINKKAIEKINMGTQFFIKNGYKEEEIFKYPPITISDIKIINDKIIGHKIKLTALKSGFAIDYDKDNYHQKFEYHTSIKTPYFTCSIKKNENFNHSIYFKLNGNSRNIYEKIIKKRLKISKLNDNVSIIKITYQDNSRNRALTYINTLIDVYIQDNIINKSKQNTKLLKFINRQLQSVGEKLKESELKLQHYRERHNVIESTSQSRLLLERLNNIEVQLAQSNIKIELVKNLNLFLENRVNLASILPILNELREEPTLQLIDTLNHLELQRHTLHSELTDRHPEMITLRQRILLIKQKLNQNISNIVQNIKNERVNLLKQKESDEEKIKKLPKKEKEIVELQRNYNVNSQMYSYLLTKESENSINKVATISDFQLLDKAYSDTRPIKPKKFLTVMASLIFGLLLGSYIAYLRHTTNRYILNIKDIKRESHLPIYMIFQNIKYLNSLKKLSTILQFTMQKENSKTILITSQKANQQKFIIDVGNTFQSLFYKILIIDCNPYNKETNIYNIKSKEKNIYKTDSKYIDILLIKNSNSSQSNHFLYKNFKEILRQVENQYDYILINPLPLSISPRNFHIMQFMGINFIIIEQAQTTKLFLKDLSSMLLEYPYDNIKLIFKT